MEPMNATAWLHDGGLELWLPTQAPSSAQTAAATTAGLDPAKVTVHTTLLGGGFGRRFETDFTIEAAELALKTGGKPVKVVWSREDDIQHDVYRPASTNAVAAALDANGRIVAYQSTIASPSILRRVFPNAVPKGGVDRISVNGVANLLYDVPNLTVDYHEHDTGIPVGFWRAPGANWNAYVTESFMDELAHAAKADPYAFRRAHLQKNPRALAVLDRAAMLGGWGKPLPAGVHRGIALCIWDGSYAAAVADITMAGNALRVQRIATAVDVGQIVNPAILTMQIESGVMYGLSAAMNGKITIEKGAVKQNNFYDYFVLRNDRAPRVEVALMPSTETPTGAGEVGTPAVAPAIGNAIFAATGKRIRSLPFDDTIKLA
jgi:isoquinoline 1-oxidoreductase beta subunit